MIFFCTEAEDFGCPLPALSPNLFQLILLAELLRSRTAPQTFSGSFKSLHFSTMGIRGLQAYANENGLLVAHRLQNCTLVIDGLNLEHELYSGYLAGHDDKAFGGDYATFTAYIVAFFGALARCQVTPVVIMDGSYEDEKRAIKLERFDQQLNQVAGAIFRGASTGGEEINSLLSSHMFAQVVKKMNVALYKSILEADDILPAIARDLGATLLSGDTDFFVENIPGGVISVKDILVDGQFPVKTDSLGRHYLQCQLYHLSRLLAKFPGLSTEVVPIAGPILGNDYLGFEEAKKLIQKLPKLDPSFRHPKFRMIQINTVFRWLATQSSPSSVVQELSSSRYSAGYKLVSYVEKNFLGYQPSRQVYPGQSVEEYFRANYHILFKREPGFPQWAHDRLVEELMPKRAISIFRNGVEFFRPLVEDFSLTQSSYETAFELCEFIYGLLRSDDRSPRAVDRYVRVNSVRANQKVMPKTMIGEDRLPMLADIASMAVDDRVALFYRILGLSSDLSQSLKKILEDSASETKISLTNQDLHDQLLTLLLSTVYMSQHFPAASANLSIDFLYALLVNILFMGYFEEEEGRTFSSSSTPKLLKLGSGDELVKKLAFFNLVPVFSRFNTYQALVVHKYNAWQSCLQNITFLSSVLDLAKVYHADTLICGLQGTFIYNLALELAQQEEPLSFLKKDLLGPALYALFEAVLCLVLDNSKRSFYAFRFNCGGDDGGRDDGGRAVLPKIDEKSKVIPVIRSAFQKKSGELYLVRGAPGQESLSNMSSLLSSGF